jgi:hypothetical protein
MPREKKVDDATNLAERMLQVLESRRSFGGSAYPLTLRELGELCDGAPSHDRIVKAAAKKAFTARAVVPVKIEKKPSLESPVYFKEDLPKPEELLAKRLLDVLENQRKLGDSAYPPTLRRLLELCEAQGPAGRLAKALGHPSVAERILVAAKKGKTPIPEAPVVWRDDVDSKMSKLLPALLHFALSSITTTTKGKTIETQAFHVADATKRLVPELRGRFSAALEHSLERGELPEEVGCVLVKGEPLLFLAANRPPRMQPAARHEDDVVSMSADGDAVLASAPRGSDLDNPSAEPSSDSTTAMDRPIS